MSHKQRVLVVGAGAAGMATAWSLSRFPEKFAVTVWEAEATAGGVATSEEFEDGRYVNDGVQGGASSYRNTMLLHEEFGFKPHPIGFRVCFGMGEHTWNNYAEDTKRSEFLVRMGPDIERLGNVLKWVMRFEFIFVFVTIRKLLSLFCFSEEFGEHMVYPLVALFFGTGNRTSEVSSAIIARVFLDPDLCLFPYDSERLMSSEAPMFAFTRLSEIYQTMSEEIMADFHFNRGCKKVDRTCGEVRATDIHGDVEVFDIVVFACNADKALNLLSEPSCMERFTLGNVKYYDDVTITHTDTGYMRKHYTIAESVEDARKNREMYYIRTEPTDRSKVEMSFNLAAYQPQLQESADPVYQTIFLNKQEHHLWTKDEIAQDKVLLTKWWHQFAHEASHFYKVVPFVRFIQNTANSWYCGAYTLVNTHEIATISGLAVAHRLGAPYPFSADPLARMQFEQYLSVIHGVGACKKICLYLLLVGMVVTAIVLLVHVWKPWN